jgi:hypothetical protein
LGVRYVPTSKKRPTPSKMTAKKATTHAIIDKELLVSLRERSSVWQCRFCIDGVWQRVTTGERDLKKATEKAKSLYIEAQVRKKNNITPITRYFKDVAKVVLAKLKKDFDDGNGKEIFKAYINAIERYLIPILGKYKMDSIDYQVLEFFDKQRLKKMRGKAPTHSTQLTHNAALNKIFDEAVYRGYLNTNNRPTLKAQGKRTERRVEFSIDEVKAIRQNFDAWIAKSRADTIELRYLLKDYVEVLLDIGARPGKELLDLKWSHIEIEDHPTIKQTGIINPPDEYDQAGSEVLIVRRNRTAYIKIMSGKTSVKQGIKTGRVAIGNLNTVQALERISQRNYQLSLKDAIKKKQQEFIFRYKQFQSEKNGRAGKSTKYLYPSDFVKLFRNYLESHNLLIDPVTGKARPLYSLRHTYATIRLLHDKITPQILVKQMGTSLGMLEKHYDHITTIKAASQLRDEESRKLIDAGGEVDKRYEFKEIKKERAKRNTRTK